MPDPVENLVSVIIPCHNQDRFLPACLDSLLSQEYRPLEIVIVNDGSLDKTAQIMETFQLHTARSEGVTVKCLHQNNRGAAYARNEGCKASRGEFIQFLDADDLLSANKISDQVRIFWNESSIDVVYGDGQYLVDFGGPTRIGRIISRGPSPDIVESLLSGKWVPSFAYLARKSAVQKGGPWDSDLQVNQDFDFFLRMAIANRRFSYKAGVNGFYRKHSFDTISEQSMLVRALATRRILQRAEELLRGQGTFYLPRIRAMAESYRRIARQVYPLDFQCFIASLNEVLRLCPDFVPESRKARCATAVMGFRNYEILAARISHIFDRRKNGWL